MKEMREFGDGRERGERVGEGRHSGTRRGAGSLAVLLVGVVFGLRGDLAQLPAGAPQLPCDLGRAKEEEEGEGRRVGGWKMEKCEIKEKRRIKTDGCEDCSDFLERQ